MFTTMLRRHCEHVLDTDALAVLPEAAVPEPLQPAADDEGPHPRGAGELWNESWYFDFAGVHQGVGGWVRLGLVANQNTAWINALLSGPDMPTIAIVDFAAALPANPADVRTGSAHLTFEATEPLQTYRVTVQGRGEAYDDPAALLRDEPGRPTELTMDLSGRRRAPRTATASRHATRSPARFPVP